MAQGLTEKEEMGINLHKKAIYTGTLTRIVTNIMQQNKASEFFCVIISNVFYQYSFYLH